MKNILAPIDLSPISRAVIDHAAELATAMKARLWLVHVAAPDPDFVGYDVGPKHVRQQRANVLRVEHGELQKFADALRSKGVDAEALLVQGPTSATILDEVARLKVDLVVMGSHGRSGLFKALLGSVCSQVLEDGQVPVLIIPARDR